MLPKNSLLTHITVIYVHSRLKWHSYSKQLPSIVLQFLNKVLKAYEVDKF